MLKAGSILVFIIFILESIAIIPLLWTIPGFILYQKVSKVEVSADQKIALAILEIVGGVLMLVDLNNDENKIQKY